MTGTFLDPRGRVGRFAPPLILMGLIYFASAQPDLTSGLGLIDLIGRKIVHATEYGLLFWLWLRAFRFRAPAAAAAIALLYAGTDEYHQTYVDGRVGTPRDVLIDATGIAIAWGIHVWWSRRRAQRAAQGGPGGQAEPGGQDGPEGPAGPNRSDPAALGGDQDGLRAVDGPELAVDVVQVGPNGARRE